MITLETPLPVAWVRGQIRTKRSDYERARVELVVIGEEQLGGHAVIRPDTFRVVVTDRSARPTAVLVAEIHDDRTDT
jgi:hypothetical protein